MTFLRDRESLIRIFVSPNGGNFLQKEVSLLNEGLSF